MEKCVECGKTALLKTSFGKQILCSKCAGLINASSWNKRNFTSIDDLLEKKNNAINLAKQNNFSDKIINEINRFFDEYINDGFITSINGKAGQTLKVFENYSIVNTKSDNARDELIYSFIEFDDDEENNTIEEEDIISADDKLQLAKSFIKGGIIKTGLNIAMSAGLKQSAKEQNEEKRAQKRIIDEKNKEKILQRIIKVGDKKLPYDKFSLAYMFSKSDNDNGYLKFVPNGINEDDIYNCEYFFFNNSIPFESKKIKSKVKEVEEIIQNKINIIASTQKNKEIEGSEKNNKVIEEENNKKIKTENSKEEKDKFEEIRKYKKLLDEGIITNEEFEIKKKELLDL